MDDIVSEMWRDCV